MFTFLLLEVAFSGSGVAPYSLPSDPSSVNSSKEASPSASMRMPFVPAFFFCLSLAWQVEHRTSVQLTLHIIQMQRNLMSNNQSNQELWKANDAQLHSEWTCNGISLSFCSKWGSSISKDTTSSGAKRSPCTWPPVMTSCCTVLFWLALCKIFSSTVSLHINR